MGFSNWLGKTAFENIDATTLKVEECGDRLGVEEEKK